jgi:hypothetical protein
MNCSKCGVSSNKEPLYRNNANGKTADWRCGFCLSKEPDPVTKKICEDIID